MREIEKAKFQTSLTDTNLILGFFGWYGLMMSVPLFITGTFTGLHLFLGAVIHLVVALISFSCREGLKKKSAIAWWFGLGIGMAVGLTCIGMIWNMIEEKVFILVLFFPSALSLVFSNSVQTFQNINENP